MKKISLFLSVILTAATAFAEGYQVNTLSARQSGMGHVGTGMKLGAESMHFNPAGMAFMDKTIDISVGVTAIAATAKYTAGGKEYVTDNKISTPLYAYAAFSIYKNLKAGISFTTPYGSSINWTNNWPGAVLAQNVNLQSYNIQPTFSWRIIDRLSVGAGLMIAWGNVDLNKGLVSGSSADILLALMQNDYRFGTTTPASVNLKGVSEVAVGYNIGAMFDVTNQITVGISYRSKMSLKVKSGDAKVTYVNDVAKELLEKKVGLINKANFKAEMPLPYNLSFGISYRPVSKLQVAFDAQFTGWKAYKVLNIEFLDEKLKPFDQKLQKNYNNSWAFRLGAEYAVTPRFDARIGIYYDNTPVNINYYNPETPGMDKIAPSLGFSFRPIKNLSIDFSCTYVAGLGADDAKYTYEDIILKALSQQNPAVNPVLTFTGNYKVHAWNTSIGLSYSF